MGPLRPPFQWESGSFQGLKRPWRGAGQSPPCNGEVKDAWNYSPIPYVFMAWYLGK